MTDAVTVPARTSRLPAAAEDIAYIKQAFRPGERLQDLWR